jgi:hypothetical protein
MSSAAPSTRRAPVEPESLELAKAHRQIARLSAELEAVQRADDAEFERLVDIISETALAKRDFAVSISWPHAHARSVEWP